MIGSMTPDERREPAIINGSRRPRIARGSGTSVSDVNRLLKQYAQLKKMMKGLKQMEGRMGKFKGAMPFLPQTDATAHQKRRVSRGSTHSTETDGTDARSRHTAWWWPTRARRATGASSRSSGTTTR